MMRVLNFSTPKPKQFCYRPRFYDERKERLEKMKARAEAELSAEKQKAATCSNGLQKGFLNESRVKSKLRRTTLEKSSTLRVFIILLALLGIFYLWQPDLFMAFWKIK